MTFVEWSYVTIYHIEVEYKLTFNKYEIMNPTKASKERYTLEQ